MTDIIQDFAREHLYRFAVIIALCMAAMVAGMVIDLILGIRKAKANHEATTSRGLKKTCDKARKYFTPYLSAVCIDIVAACANVPVPVFSMLWAAYCCICEFISIREKSWQKAEIRKQEQTMRVILENKDDIAHALCDILKRAEESEKKGGEA